MKVVVTQEQWEVKPLGEVCKLRNGFAFKSTDYKKEGIPIIRISDINGGAVSNKKSVRVGADTEFDNYLVEANDILVAMSGATTGKFGIYKSNDKAYQNQRVGKFQIHDRQKLDSNFLLYQLNALKRNIEKDAYGGAQPNISSAKIEAMEILLPPIDIQRNIVSRIEELFSEVDKGVEEIKTAQQQLKVYRQGVLKWAFEGRLTNVDIKENELPKGWKLQQLKEICKIIGGVTKGRDFKGKETIFLPYLRVANVQDGYLNLKEIKTIEALPIDKAKYKLEYGDILYTEGGDKDKLGRGTIWKNEVQDCIHQNHVFRARPLSKDFDSKYIAFFSQTKSAKNYFYKHGKQTTNLASINLTVLSNLPIPICTLAEQQQIVQEIESRLSVCDKIEETITTSLKQAEALRQSILKKAFEGKLLKKEAAVYKPKSVYFYQTQTLGFISYYSSKHNIEHGEMTIAKFAYLLDKVYKIPTYYTYERWHLGPYPPEMKKAIKNKKFFKQTDNKIDVADVDEFLKYNNPNKEKIASAIDELAEIFSGYSRKDRSHKTELLATACKVVEDIKSVELGAVRQSMNEWIIDLPTTKLKNKAEKFSEEETVDCLKFIVERGWDQKLIYPFNKIQ